MDSRSIGSIFAEIVWYKLMYYYLNKENKRLNSGHAFPFLFILKLCNRVVYGITHFTPYFGKLELLISFFDL